MLDLNNNTITSTHEFSEGSHIWDIAAIDDTHFLLAAKEGLLKTTKDQLLKHYHKGKLVDTICHIADSFYLLGLVNEQQLCVWNEHTD